MHPILKTTTPSQVAQTNGTEVKVEAIVKQLYEITSVTNETPEEISDKLAELIVNNIEIFIPQANSSSSRMLAKFQEAMVIFTRSRTNDDVFTQKDITTALQAIKEKIILPVLKETIERYEENGSEHLLDTGLVLFYGQTGGQIKLNLGAQLPRDLEFALLSALSLSDHISLAETDRQNHVALNRYYSSILNLSNPETIRLSEEGKSVLEIFSISPACRQDKYVPCDEKGRRYLDTLGIGGPITGQKIRNGEWTIDAAIARRESKLAELREVLEPAYGKEMVDKAITNQPGIAKYLIDGLMTIERLEKAIADIADKSRLHLLSDPAVQKYLDNGKLSMEEVFMFKTDDGFLLEQDSVQKDIDSGYSREEAYNRWSREYDRKNAVLRS